jgi:integrase
MRRCVQLQHLNRSGTWPSGNPRLYYRPKGEKGIPLPDLPMTSSKFLKAYAEATEKVAKGKEAPDPINTFGSALVAYLGSPAFAKIGDATRARRRRHLDDMRKRYGKALLKDLLPRHIRRDLADLQPHAANDRLKTWRGLCKWAVRTGRMDANPAAEVEKPELPQSDGWTPWADDDVAKFRAYWAIGTMQRLCFEILHRSCAAIGDACKLTRGNIEDGWLVYQRGKTEQLAVVPWERRHQPAWFGTDDLDACLQGHQHLSFIVTSYGKTRSEKGATQWFAKACRQAGLEGLSAHGVRKYRAASFKERGALPEQRMAILGHATETEASRYAKSADLKRVISRTGGSNRSSNIVPTSRRKP